MAFSQRYGSTLKKTAAFDKRRKNRSVQAIELR
jgi:hypothetical protein